MSDASSRSSVLIPDRNESGTALLRVDGLCVSFAAGAERGRSDLPSGVVDGVSFEIQRGRTLALVGESGCGKSITALSILRLLPSQATITAGAIHFDGTDLLSLTPRALNGIRGRRIGMIFQEPMTALNPLMRVGTQIAEVVAHHQEQGRQEAWRSAVALLTEAALPDAERIAQCYPHHLSGGMRQRVMIALALAGGPDLIIADEPTTALDVTIQNQVLWLLRDLTQARGAALLLITHDLGVVAAVADDLAVMYAGRVVERGPARDVLAAPRHPYTEALLRCVPRLRDPGGRLHVISGAVPRPGEWPTGCRFHPRCERAGSEMRCRAESPELRGVGDARASACWKSDEMAVTP